jgi:hypothetical protein
MTVSRDQIALALWIKVAVNGAVLREIIRANCVRKCLVTTATGLKIEFRPVEAGELTIRTLLTAPPRDGGLLGRVPVAQVEAPRQEVAEKPAAMVPDDRPRSSPAGGRWRSTPRLARARSRRWNRGNGERRNFKISRRRCDGSHSAIRAEIRMLTVTCAPVERLLSRAIRRAAGVAVPLPG